MTFSSHFQRGAKFVAVTAICGISIVGLCILLFKFVAMVGEASEEETAARYRQSQADMERAYFDGQRDALQGNVRVEWDDNLKHWRWTKSPWSTGRTPVYDLSVEPEHP